MNENNDYNDLIKTTFYAYLTGSIIMYWGYSNEGIFRVILGVLIIIVFSKSAIGNYKFIKELKIWKKENEGRIIFFYPTSKKIQERIQQEIIPLVPNDTLKVYYDGPSIVGDIKRPIIKDLMYQFKDLRVNSPSISKIINEQFFTESLRELIHLDKGEVDIETIKSKISKIVELKINVVKL